MEDIFDTEQNTVEKAGPDVPGGEAGLSADEGDLTAGEVLLKLDSFEGPFDLLLNLINRRNIDITEISISAVTDVYIDVVFKFGGFNADIASEYLVMAARLIYLKTKRLMPSEDTGEAGEMTEADIAERVRIYEKYKLAAETLADFYLIWQDSLCRGREIIDFPKIEESVELDVNSLIAGYDRARMRYESLNRDNKEKMDVILKIEKVSIKEKISKIVTAVKERSKFKFSELFNVKTNSIPELVTGFLALLELGKLDAIKTEQNEVFGDIIIRRKHKDIDNIKINMEDYNEWSD
ncbi:MAG: segregation/condensation protein A [Clostridia bacterium]|nr:segregation/condensation protein A [Clostridia bacterium]